MAQAGLQAVFLAQRPMLVRLLAARLGSADDAEDVLQDMWMRLDGLADRPVAQPAAFLFRVAANMATDRRLSGERRVARDHAWHEAQDVSDELPDAERALIARDKLRRIEAAMADMPERMRTALTMFRVEERPQREIAARLAISVSGVEKLLQRAYRIITAAADDDGAGLPDRPRLAREGESPGAD